MLKYDVAFIVSTTIVNDTVDDLLEAASDCRETVMHEGTWVTCLSDVIVDAADGLLRVGSEGGGIRLFGPFVTKRNISLRHHLAEAPTENLRSVTNA